MITKQLGSSTISVPPLILGGNMFGHFCDKDATRAVFDAADELGFRAVDTADVYTDGVSEEFVGAALKGRRERFVILTKIGIHTDESPRGKFTPAAIRRSLEGGLKRLGTDYVDLYQLHAYDDQTPLADQIGTLIALREEGKIRAFGVSNYSGRELAEACQISAPVSVQIPWNWLDREVARDLIPVCEANTVSILPYATLARGLLTGKYGEGTIPTGSRAAASASLRDELTPERLAAIARFILEARSRGLKPSIFALAWLLAQPRVAGLMVGVRTPEQLRELAPTAAVTL